MAKAHDQANAVASTVISKFEAFLPQYKGLIRKTWGDLALFVAYKLLVVYVLLKVVFFAFSALQCFVCCLCCCGCCCLRSKKGKDLRVNGNAKPKAKGAAASGKAAVKASSGKKSK